MLNKNKEYKKAFFCLQNKVPEKVYDRFVLHCLDCAVAVSPCFEIPSIVPFGAERGVFGKLKAKPFEF